MTVLRVEANNQSNQTFAVNRIVDVLKSRGIKTREFYVCIIMKELEVHSNIIKVSNSKFSCEIKCE